MITYSKGIREVFERKRFHAALFMIFLAIPLVIAAGVFILPQTWYMAVSVVVLILTMAPFFMIFEHRKPKAREIVLLAMMTALTAGTHMSFHVILPIQIGSALVIVSGISLGPEAGFLIGALARFVCNFYMGQGAWTPWQMFCWGILGFLAGMAFNRGDTDTLKSIHFKAVIGPIMFMVFSFAAAYLSLLIWPGEDGSNAGWRFYVLGAIGLIIGAAVQKKRLPIDGMTLALFTFFTVFVVYGGIMNLSTLILSINSESGGMSFDAVRALFAAGAPYDFVHAFTASVCAFLIGGNIIKKLERVKIKYGIYK